MIGGMSKVGLSSISHRGVWKVKLVSGKSSRSCSLCISSYVMTKRKGPRGSPLRNATCDFYSDAMVVFGGGVVAVSNPVDKFLA